MTLNQHSGEISEISDIPEISEIPQISEISEISEISQISATTLHIKTSENPKVITDVENVNKYHSNDSVSPNYISSPITLNGKSRQKFAT